MRSLVEGMAWGAIPEERPSVDAFVVLSVPQAVYSRTDESVGTDIARRTVLGADDLLSFVSLGHFRFEWVFTWHQRTAIVIRVECATADSEPCIPRRA